MNGWNSTYRLKSTATLFVAGASFLWLAGADASPEDDSPPAAQAGGGLSSTSEEPVPLAAILDTDSARIGFQALLTDDQGDPLPEPTVTPASAQQLLWGEQSGGGQHEFLTGAKTFCTHPLFLSSRYGAGSRPRSVAVGDLDGVNGPDLAVVANGLSGNVSVLLNQGDGTFALAAAYASRVSPTSVCIGDLDGVNGPDLAVANWGSYNPDCACYDNGGISVLLNQGDGTFAPAAAYADGHGLRSIAIGDLDGVSGPDLAAANYQHDVSVLLNHGDGTFAAPADYAVGDLPRSVAIGDLDGVNGPDLVVVAGGPCFGCPPGVTSGNISVLLNQGNGSFAPAVAYVGGGPRSVAIGDLDGVNGPDLAVVVNSSSDYVSVLLNNGNGTFAAAVAYAAGYEPVSVAIGDLDGVNGPDLAIANSSGDDVSVLLNLGTSACGDFDGDGDVDTADFAAFAQCFGGSNVPPAPTCPAGIDADLDGDGDVDTLDFVVFGQQYTGSR